MTSYLLPCKNVKATPTKLSVLKQKHTLPALLEVRCM